MLCVVRCVVLQCHVRLSDDQIVGSIVHVWFRCLLSASVSPFKDLIKGQETFTRIVGMRAYPKDTGTISLALRYITPGTIMVVKWFLQIF